MDERRRQYLWRRYLWVMPRKQWRPIRVAIAWLGLVDSTVEILTFGFVFPELSVNLIIWNLRRRYKAEIVPLQEDLIDELADIAAESHERFG